ncbi:MAG: tetratricopeptide repeat protein [Candidatus Binatia bacterium]
MARIDEIRSGFWQRWLGGRPVPPPAGPRNEGLEAFQEGRHGDAERLLVADLARLERQQPQSMSTARALVDLGELYRGLARFSEAEPLFRRAIGLIETVAGDGHRALLRPLNSLALVYRAQGLYAQAEPLARRALAIAEGTHGPEHPTTAGVVGNLLTVYLAQGRYGEAAPLFQRSVSLKERLLGPKHPDLASSLSNYAAFLRKTQNEGEAAVWEARARAIGGGRVARG